MHGARYFKALQEAQKKPPLDKDGNEQLLEVEQLEAFLPKLRDGELKEANDFYDEFEKKNRWLTDFCFDEEDADNLRAFLACNDRFYLLTRLLGRDDLNHYWLYDRAREVELDPYGRLDLWARFHGKSSIITFGGIIQEIIRDPEVTIAIFSATKPLATEFLAQIKGELETNDDLKRIFADILYENPRGKSPIKVSGEPTGDTERPAKWGIQRGITVRRKGHPKEATVEAHGLIDGQPTGRHFMKHYYDDIVHQDYLSEEQLKKTTERFELADNLGTRHGVDKCIAGTRYHFADTYGVIIERGAAKERRHTATADGTMNGPLVLLDVENWEKIKRTQGMKTLSAQMLLNPVAGNEATFSSLWLRNYDVIPRIMNVYILVDPSKGMGERSDRTAIAVIGIDPGNNKYLLDGFCHRMRLNERIARMDRLYAKWTNVNGVQIAKVGYERYGMVSDLEVIEEQHRAQNNLYPIEELNTPRQGGHSKNDRIERLEPDIRNGRFYLPCIAHHPEFASKTGEFAGQCYWTVWGEKDVENAKRMQLSQPHHLGQIIYRPVKGLTRRQQEFKDTNSRIVQPLKRLDENNNVYDLTRVFIDEMVRHPFAQHDDLIDACSRIYDIEPYAPVAHEAKATDTLDADDQGLVPTDEAGGVDYDD
jgi:hypothetical protein